MKYALLTGASGGIGKAAAYRLAERGYGLYLHYHKNQDEIEALKTQLKQFDLPIHLLRADLSKKEAVKEMLPEIVHEIDTVIHNSGNSFFGLMTDMEDNEVFEMVQLQITSPFLLTKYLLPSMIRKKSGNIIVISSIWGITGASCEVLYSMVKGGLNTFVKALAKEVAPSGIRVNGIAPGAIATNMLSHLSKAEISELEEAIPMGRLGEPSEVAHLVDFLLSKRSAYINGQIISINGAWY
ncbi:short chain dehydrogenase [Pueribacillus theae]|uniref:Short chain dehydrogenase n=1 Tax=Pueribacillus theae TaxID=2171751 RepID=A0A2U1K875_9BACI|nr:SDR family oxidoreductase [Pueribacillus theae]PWA13565.1 short chain dehydrogenase [Pueribacillus theae]